jgi:ribosomal protein S18 acetylase RimI-like enzyme
MRVREMTALDRDPVVALHRRAARELGAEAYGDRRARAWAGDRCRCDYGLRDANATFVVAVTAPGETRAPVTERSPGPGEGDVAGYGHLQRDAGEVQAVYVSPTYARTGVGSRLLACLEERARDATLESLELVSSKNAVGFYRRHGYRVTEETTVTTTGDGETATLEVSVMEKALPASDRA